LPSRDDAPRGLSTSIRTDSNYARGHEELLTTRIVDDLHGARSDRERPLGDWTRTGPAAAATCYVEGHGYEVADLEVFNVAPDFDDFARDLMT
jgi:hypothetical protein